MNYNVRADNKSTLFLLKDFVVMEEIKPDLKLLVKETF